MAQRIEVACTIMIEKDGKLLLVKEGGRETYGKWNQPSGKLEAHENLLECAMREAKEQTGFTVQLTTLQGVYSRIDQGDEHYLNFCFKAKLKDAVQCQLKSDILEVRWFTKEELAAVPTRDLRHELAQRRLKDWFANKAYPLELICSFWGTKYR